MEPHRRWIESQLVPRALRSADRIVCVSKSTADAIQSEFPFVKDKVRVVSLGVTALPAPSTKECLQRFGIDRPYVLFVGTLEPRKNLQRLLKAYASLSHKLRRDYLLVIAGPQGWGGLDVRTEAVRLGIFESIKVTGYVSEDVLSTLYYHAEFLAFPSLYEGFGLPIVEAMAAGTPVLTSNVSSMPEVAGDAALLVDPFDEESIADGLKTLLTLESEALRLASRARANAARFSWQIAARELHDVLAEAVRVRRGDA